MTYVNHFLIYVCHSAMLPGSVTPLTEFCDMSEMKGSLSETRGVGPVKILTLR
ncbi:hypothetical protein SAMN05519105_0257 [Rhodobacter sp. 24-YEA-8]|nr:hypothetical protein SAMN05519105_0257 [Rhodobacter sp. 24-YEA-8]